MMKKEKNTFSEEILTEFNHELTEEEKIIEFYSFLEILKMKQNVSFSRAYFGKSIINKLEFVLAFFRIYSLKEHNGNKGDYIILDGKNITDDYDALVKAFEETKDIPFVIFTQSEFILTNDDNISLIKYLNEYNRKYNSAKKSFTVSSRYIFLSDHNCLENVTDVKKEVFYSLVPTIFGDTPKGR